MTMSPLQATKTNPIGHFFKADPSTHVVAPSVWNLSILRSFFLEGRYLGPRVGFLLLLRYGLVHNFLIVSCHSSTISFGGKSQSRVVSQIF